MLKLCLIGDPVAHSRSPGIHAALLRRSGIAGTYVTVTVKEKDLPAFLAAARAGDWDGFNVTMPLKQAILPLLDTLDPSAAAAGAVNTVTVRQGRAVGYNTDGAGFVKSLPFTVRGKRVLMLGNGGAAGALRAALTGAGAEVRICCRRPRPGELPWARLTEEAARCDVLVNATPLGMAGRPDFEDLAFLAALPAGALVYDLVYAPEDTALLHAARALGRDTCGGFAMLQAQAELAFALFAAHGSGGAAAAERNGGEQ